ncbi:MAG TPA: energy transducer TonB [Thermoanaerobaculia bacterium]|nr:energy transducer TonB [Thermoanaerobaculia bacterium]
MSEKKQCINCGRGIDTAAKSCLFCNWWQAEKPPVRTQPAPVEAAAAPPPHEHHWNRTVLGAIAFGALLIIAFVIGSLVHGFEPSEVKAAQQPKTPAAAVATQAPAAPPTANVPLVPDNSPPPGPLEQPAMTTTVNGAMSTDATAMTSTEYGQLVPPPQQPPVQTIDPRSVTGSVYGEAQAQPPRIPRPHRIAAMPHIAQTQPVPEYQPVPPLHGHGHAKLTLTVGTDGRVHDVDIVQPLAGEMGRLIGAVQSWRFRPAMDNGVPVTSRFTVDINVE